MRVLLDTHVLIWALIDPARLPSEADRIIGDGQNEILFSAVSIWEVAIKVRLGRRGFNFEPDVVLSAAKATGLVELPIDARTGLVLRRLPAVHDDPFDRLLVSQAIDAGVVFLTSDAALPPYSPLVRLV